MMAILNTSECLLFILSCFDDMFRIDCKVPAVNVSNERGRQEVVQRSTNAVGRQSMGRENLEAGNQGLLGSWTHCTFAKCA